MLKILDLPIQRGEVSKVPNVGRSCVPPPSRGLFIESITTLYFEYFYKKSIVLLKRISFPANKKHFSTRFNWISVVLVPSVDPAEYLNSEPSKHSRKQNDH